MTKKRRTKGEGSVYRRKDGRVVGEYEDAHGRTRYITSTKMSKAEMKTAIRKKLEDRDNGIVRDSENLTVAEYLDRWLESTRDTVGLRTYQRSEETSRLHITPTLGKTKLEKLTAMQLDGLYRKKLKAGLSPRSVQIIHATAHKALKQAVRWRLVRENVAEHTTPPKSTKREMQALTAEQAQILLRTAVRKQPHLYALYTLAITTGARLGELLALQPSDVLIEHGLLRISKSVHNGRVTAPKTTTGNRTIKLSKLALDAVEDHLDAHAGDTWLFPSPVKDMSIHRATLHISYWKPLLKAAGLPQDTRFHDLRHTAASLMLGQNIPLPVVSYVLGHSNPAITGTIYAHMLSNMSGYGAAAMDEALS
jgi:integrase